MTLRQAQDERTFVIFQTPLMLSLSKHVCAMGAAQ